MDITFIHVKRSWICGHLCPLLLIIFLIMMIQNEASVESHRWHQGRLGAKSLSQMPKNSSKTISLIWTIHVTHSRYYGISRLSHASHCHFKPTFHPPHPFSHISSVVQQLDKINTNTVSIYCIWPFIEAATVISTQGIWFLLSICELYTEENLLCDIFYAKSKWMDVNPPDLWTSQFYFEDTVTLQ